MTVVTVPASANGKTKAKKLQNQTVPKWGRLCDLLTAFKAHSKRYMAHNEIAKLQRHCHLYCLETFKDGDIVIETDFAEKYTHHSIIGMMMPVYPQTTLMVAITHFNSQTLLGGVRVHTTETWIFASEEMNHDYCDFHLHGLASIADCYLRGDGSEATAAARNEARAPRIHMFTDRCAEQYKGRAKVSRFGGQRAADRLLRRPPLRGYVSFQTLKRLNRRRDLKCNEEKREVWRTVW